MYAYLAILYSFSHSSQGPQRILQLTHLLTIGPSFLRFPDLQLYLFLLLLPVL